MPRMLSRIKSPPHGWQCLHPESGMAQPFTSCSFNQCVSWELSWRRKNPSLAAKLGLGTDVPSIEAWVDESNAHRMVQHGWLNFVDMTADPIAPPVEGVKKNWRASAAAIARKGQAAFTAYRSLFGKEGPVSSDLARQRALTCLACPQNDIEGGFKDRVIESAAEDIMALLSFMKDMNLSLPEDDKLGICKACGCPMRSKVWVHIGTIAKRVPTDVWTKLQRTEPVCWIKSETKDL